MSKSPFITILTAALNSGSTIKKTLESVRNQTFQDMEHIVIDGGSCDETRDILKAFESSYNLTWISEQDSGIADALNKGLKRATGRYVLVIQADDQLLNSNILERVYHLLKDERFDMYSFHVIMDDPVRGNVLRKPIRLLWWNRFKFIFPHQGCFVHRRVFEKIGGFRKEFKINMDYDFFYRAIAHGCSTEFGQFPVTLMGGAGLGSDPKFMLKRLKEERLVQLLNEKSLFWKMAQFLFFFFYMPYKIRRLQKSNH